MRRMILGALWGLGVLLFAVDAQCDEMNLDYNGSPAAWGQTSVPISTKLCVTLRTKPAAPDGSRINLVVQNGAAWTEVTGATPWPKANWSDNNSYHCWEAPEGKKTYTLAVLASGAAPPALSSNSVSITENTAPGSKDGQPTAQDVQTAAVLAAARQYAATTTLPGSTVSRSPVTARGEVTLYFYPDGNEAVPVPADLSERDTIHLKVLMPKSDLGTATLDVTACPDENPLRVQGTFKQAAGFAHGAVEIAVQDLGDLRCGSGQVSFEIKSAYGSHSTSLKLGDVYWGTFAVQFTFDFTQSGSLGTATNAGGQTVITRNTDPLGPSVVPSFVWHPVGYDIRHPSVLGVLLNPSLGFDVNAMTSSFYLGDQICAVGLCLAAGAHIRKVDELTGTSGLSVGSTFDPTKGALPTEQRWSSSDGGIGGFIGATLDVNTALSLLGK